MDTDQILRQIKTIVDTTTNILITGQGNPDGDSLGSQLALYELLVQQKRLDNPDELPEIIICNDFLPTFQYSFLPNIDIIKPFEAIRHHRFDIGFVLDSGTDRVGKVFSSLQTCRHIINIDHHQSKTKGIETVAWVEPTICSVAEMIYAFFEHPNWQISLTPNIASCLYAGIIYDTGSFRYSNTSSRTHQIAAKLLETGIDFAKISEKMSLEKPLSSIRLLKEVLGTLQCHADGEIICGQITQEMLKDVGATMEEEEGIITRYAFTKGTKVAVLFKEFSKHEVKVSFRARGAIDVGRFAQKISPQGGGHHRAAGCTLYMSMEEAQKNVLSELEKELG